MIIIEYLFATVFLLAFFAGLVLQILLLKWSDWKTIPSIERRVYYISWGVYSKRLILNHVIPERRRKVLYARAVFLTMLAVAFSFALSVVLGRLVA